ncbi:protein kinase family protein [Herbidospora solisilvae]|nr:serine/threonine protein kinase [Herbidospora solisilvae]
MSTVEPGTRLADRFRLEDRVNESSGATFWKAIDEVLARPVAVHTFSPDFERQHEVVIAARAASRLTDPRLTQVFDAADEDGVAYVVSEWVSGESLLDLLSAGPLEAERGAALVAEAAEAIAHAHEHGLAHLNLTPNRLMWTSGNTVKVLGVGVDAAILDAAEGLTEEERAQADAEGLGRLLYAALTGHWPSPDDDCGLPEAPVDDAHYCTPRQVTAGVPNYLDTITSRILGLRKSVEPMDSPMEVAEALAEVPRPAPASVSTLPPAVELRSEPVDTIGRPPMPPMIHRPAPRRSPALSRFVLTVVVLLAMVVVGVGAWTLGKSLGTEPAVPTAAPSATAGEEGQAAGKPVEVKIAGATGFDPLGDGEERNELAALAIDGSATTDWHSETYGGPDFGRLKEGVGLLLDLGKETRLTQAVIDFGASGGTVELRTGASPEPDGLKTFLTRENVSGKVTFDLNGSSPTRYLLVWFTELPPHNNGFRTMIRDVKLMGVKE